MLLVGNLDLGRRLPDDFVPAWGIRTIGNSSSCHAEHLVHLLSRPSAESSGIFGQGQVRFVGAGEGGADAVGELVGGEQAGGLGHAALAMQPLRFSEPMLLHVLFNGVNTC
jgi:hypothetical protein